MSLFPTSESRVVQYLQILPTLPVKSVLMHVRGKIESNVRLCLGQNNVFGFDVERLPSLSPVFFPLFSMLFGTQHLEPVYKAHLESVICSTQHLESVQKWSQGNMIIRETTTMSERERAKKGKDDKRLHRSTKKKPTKNGKIHPMQHLKKSNKRSF